MYDLADLLANIKKALEEVEKSQSFFASPQSLNEKDRLQTEMTKLELVLSSTDPLLRNIVSLCMSNGTLGILACATVAARAEVKRSQQLAKMVSLNLKPIPLPSGIPGMLEGPIKKTMVPAEERAMGSSLLTLAADLSALFVHVEFAAELFEIAVNTGTIKGE